MYDILIRNGILLDGAGNEGYKADIGIKDGLIAAIGTQPVSYTHLPSPGNRFPCP